MIANTQRANRASRPGTSLAERVAGGMPAALAELYGLCAAPILGLCLRILGDQALAEDALQEFFLRVWVRARLFEPKRGAAMA